MSETLTKQDLFDAFALFAEKVDKRFDAIDVRFEGIDARLDTLESRLNRVEALMVTKDYLDERLWALRGDMVALMRKGGLQIGSVPNFS